MPRELGIIHALACPASDDCVLDIVRDGSSHAWVLRHYKWETTPSIEGNLYIYDVEIADGCLYSVAAARIAPRIKTDHEYWTRGPMSNEWNEETERRRLQPV